MRSVLNVRKNLLLSTNDMVYDIITITETWLNNFHMNNEFMSDNYNIFRKDRSESSIEEHRGGGVLIAIKKEIDCDEYSIPEMENLESICIKIPLKNGSLFIYCLYIQPTKDMEKYEAHVDALNKLKIGNNDSLLITGDFNLPSVQWIENDDRMDFIPIIGESSSVEANIARYVTDSMIQLGLSQMNNIQNACDNVLDLIYTNVPELAISEKATMRLIPEEMSDNAMIYDVFEKFVPKATIKPSNNPTWYNKQLCNMKNVRNRHYK